MTPVELILARQRLRMSREQLAEALQLQSASLLADWESGDDNIPGPVDLLVRQMLAGQKTHIKTPTGWQALHACLDIIGPGSMDLQQLELLAEAVLAKMDEVISYQPASLSAA